jgi:dihydrolipoamide dehydrogenase
MPKEVHTFPPIATVGLTEEEAAEQGLNIKIGQFPLMSNGYSALSGKTEGFIKVVSEFDTHLILGIHMIGEGALELISSGTIALEMAARDEDLTFSLYPHPSISEAVLEAAEMLNGKAIHIPPKPKSEKMKVKFL